MTKREIQLSRLLLAKKLIQILPEIINKDNYLNFLKLSIKSDNYEIFLWLIQDYKEFSSITDRISYEKAMECIFLAINVQNKEILNYYLSYNPKNETIKIDFFTKIIGNCIIQKKIDLAIELFEKIRSKNLGNEKLIFDLASTLVCYIINFEPTDSSYSEYKDKILELTCLLYKNGANPFTNLVVKRRVEWQAPFLSLLIACNICTLKKDYYKNTRFMALVFQNFYNKTTKNIDLSKIHYSYTNFLPYEITKNKADKAKAAILETIKKSFKFNAHIITGLEQLNLAENKIDFETIFEILNTFRNLKTLILTGSDLTNSTFNGKMYDGFGEKIEVINLSKSKICFSDQSSVSKILSLLNQFKSLKFFCISNNDDYEYKNNEHISFFCEIINQNKLKGLNIAQNKIDDQGLLLIGNSLRKNTSLKSLVIDNNLITQDGLNYFSKELSTNYTIYEVQNNSKQSSKDPLSSFELEAIIQRNKMISDKNKSQEDFQGQPLDKILNTLHLEILKTLDENKAKEFMNIVIDHIVLKDNILDQNLVNEIATLSLLNDEQKNKIVVNLRNLEFFKKPPSSILGKRDSSSIDSSSIDSSSTDSSRLACHKPQSIGPI